MLSLYPMNKRNENQKNIIIHTKKFEEEPMFSDHNLCPRMQGNLLLLLLLLFLIFFFFNRIN